MSLEKADEALYSEHYTRLGWVHETNVAFPRPRIIRHRNWREGAWWDIERHGVDDGCLLSQAEYRMCASRSQCNTAEMK
jgi:hypothetical protein